MAGKDFQNGDLVGWLDGVWVSESSAKREIMRMNSVGLHHPFKEMYFDVSVFKDIDNPFVNSYDFFKKEYLNCKAVLTDIENSLHGILPRVLMVATKAISAGDELSYEKGKNYYCNLATFQKLTLKEQENCKSYYDITLSDLNPIVKSWKVVTSRQISELAHPLNSVGAENSKAKKAKNSCILISCSNRILIFIFSLN